VRHAESRFANSTRRAVVAGVMALLGCASLALGTSSALADTTHGPVNFEFGQSGKPTSTFGHIDGIAYDQADKRLLVMGHKSIYAFSNPAPGVLTPLPAPFPLITEAIAPDFMVDNSSSPTAGRIYLSEGHYLTGWNSAGEPIEGFQGHQFETGGSNRGGAVDNQGRIFLGQRGGENGNSLTESVGIFGTEGGGQSDQISIGASVGQPYSLAIDQTNNDVWVSSEFNSAFAHYTEASGYTSFTKFTGLGLSVLAINSARHVIYVGDTGFSSAPGDIGTIQAYSTVSGELLDSFQLPGPVNNQGIAGLAVQESSDILFVAGSNGRVLELRPLAVPRPTTEDPIADSTVSGTADPDGAGTITECFFEFGPTTAYGSTQPCDQAPPLTTLTAVAATLPGLTAETPYHYRLVLGNANGRKRGADRTITSHHVNGLRTDPASALSRTEATLGAHYEGTNKETHFHFEWGLAGAAYEHSTPDEVKAAGLGNTPLSFAITGLFAGTAYHYRVVAENDLGSSVAQEVTFTTPPAVAGLSTDPATDVTKSSAALRGTLNPDGLATTYYFQYGHSTAYGLTVPAHPGLPVGSTASVPTQVDAEATGLEAGTSYHYRIVAVNSFGTTVATDDRAFSTAQPPSVTSFTSRNVTANSAELVAKVNPNEAGSTYRFEYGTTLAYGSKLPIPDGTIAAGPTEEAVTVQLTDLEADTYHFRVIAESKWGTTTTRDQTFNFFPAACPNAHLREQTGASYLPDCRAYEMVSPLSAGNVFLVPDGPIGPRATSPARLAFTGILSTIEGTGEAQNGSDLYVATRTPNGWVTKYVGIPASEAAGSSGPPNEDSSFTNLRYVGVRASEDLSRFLAWNSNSGSYAPYIRTAEGAGLGRLPTDLADFPGAELGPSEGGFVGDVEVSKDFSHFLFSSRNISFAEGGLSISPGSVYSDDVDTGEVTLISKTPQGDPIPQDTGNADEYIEIPAVSVDGSHVLMSTQGPGGARHLYMTVDGIDHYDVSKGQDGLNHAVKYVGMTEDGSTVYFTSAEGLTADDHDNSTDLFMWREGGPATVTRVSAGSGGAGNSDACQVTWTSKCSVVPVSTDFNSDNAIASRGGDIYFISPELLDGARGTLAEKNLYVAVEGHVHFVATLPGSNSIVRIQISPDGDHMALITRARLTPSPTGGHLEMYSFDPGGSGFVCVSCPTNGEAPAHDVEGSQNGLFMSDDGRTFFSTTDALVPQDTDGLRDSYEYVDSRAQLLTTGTADRAEDTGFVGVSSDGVDAYFSTLETLVPQDTVGPFLKFYDARTGGGIPLQREAAPCAAADECHGPEPGASAKLPATTGAALGAGGNLRSPRHRRKTKGKKHRPQHRGHHHDSRSGHVKRKGTPRG
jgi:hypothetical protein